MLAAASEALAGNLIERMDSVRNSLVRIQTVYVKMLRGEGRMRMASFERNGAGVIIDPAGLVVTNTHTILNAPHIFVILNDGTKAKADVAFISSTGDFSFLKISPVRPLKAIEWAESSQAQLGQEIVAIGNSDYVRKSILGGKIMHLIQSQSTGRVELLGVDLNLYKGDSGGPILDVQGRLLGLVMGEEKSQEHSSVAIASDTIREQYLLYRREHPL